jgi:hypothetical protein
MKIESMVMAAGIWALGSVTAYAQGTAVPRSTGAQDGAGVEEEEAPAPAPAPSAPPTVSPQADTWVPGTQAPIASPPPAPVPVYEPVKPFRIGAGVLLGGGYEDFTYSNVRSMTGAGGAWNARVIAGTRQYVGLEAAYVGAARSVETLGLSTNSNLVSNGFEGAFRVNVPVVQGRALIEPFGFVGVGWQHYSLTNVTTNTSDIRDSDDIMSLPYGGGLNFSYAMFMADARFTYRQTYDNDLVRTGGRLNTWGVGGQIGVEF